jgi:sarcosine oxidase subunit delta
MRIQCPFCGERDLSEFVYLGDATIQTEISGDADSAYQAIYLRDNNAGPHAELWYHASACRTWLRVTRDTRTHVIQAVEYGRPVQA